MNCLRRAVHIAGTAIVIAAFAPVFAGTAAAGTAVSGGPTPNVWLEEGGPYPSHAACMADLNDRKANGETRRMRCLSDMYGRYYLEMWYDCLVLYSAASLPAAMVTGSQTSTAAGTSAV